MHTKSTVQSQLVERELRIQYLISYLSAGLQFSSSQLCVRGSARAVVLVVGEGDPNEVPQQQQHIGKVPEQSTWRHL